MKSTQTSIFFPLVFAASLKKNPGRSAGAGPGRRGGLRLQLPSALESGGLFSGTTLGAQSASGAVPGIVALRRQGFSHGICMDDSTWSGKRFFPFFPWSCMGLSGFNFPEKTRSIDMGGRLGRGLLRKCWEKNWWDCVGWWETHRSGTDRQLNVAVSTVSSWGL